MRRSLVLLAGLTSTPALAYVLLGADWTWEVRPHQADFYVNSSSFPKTVGSTTEVEDALEGAMDLWNEDGEANFEYPYGGTSTLATSDYSDDAVVYYDSSYASGGTLAAAGVWISGSYIAACDVVYYGGNDYGAITWSADPTGAGSGEQDVAFVGIHELGHCLGLDHSSDSSAIMYYATSGGQQEADRVLAEDDIDAIQAIYGEASANLLGTDAWGDDLGDGDTWLERGETWDLEVEVQNYGYLDTTGVTGTLSVSSSEITVTDDEGDFGDVAVGAASDTSTTGDGFTIEVDSGCTADFTETFTVDLEDDDGNTWQITYEGDVLCLTDADSDGYTTATDCDDDDATVNPGASETWYDDVDQDCDGASDYDADADGYDATLFGGEDCDDGDPAIQPDADETCDGVDQDCDGTVDEDALDPTTWYVDADDDGYGDASDTAEACDAPSGYVGEATDCDDDDADTHPDADELCGGDDEDCDGETDEDDAADAPTWYADDDDDGFGDAGDTATACDQPSGRVADATDCNDDAAEANPDGSETCDELDNDCDGLTDDADDEVTDTTTWYADEDHDGYGDAATTQDSCTAPEGWVSNGEDCLDTDVLVRPNADEECNGVDDDCDGTVDEDLTNCDTTEDPEDTDEPKEPADTDPPDEPEDTSPPEPEGEDTASADTAAPPPSSGGSGLPPEAEATCGCGAGPIAGTPWLLAILIGWRRRRPTHDIQDTVS